MGHSVVMNYKIIRRDTPKSGEGEMNTKIWMKKKEEAVTSDEFVTLVRSGAFATYKNFQKIPIGNFC